MQYNESIIIALFHHVFNLCMVVYLFNNIYSITWSEYLGQNLNYQKLDLLTITDQLWFTSKFNKDNSY